MSLELTAADLLILEHHRLYRFRSLLSAALTYCALELDKDNRLSIHCLEAWAVDPLLLKLKQLRWAAWIVLGAPSLSIYFANEELYRTSTRLACKQKQIKS